MSDAMPTPKRKPSPQKDASKKRLAKVKRRLELLARLEDSLAEVSKCRTAQKWIQTAAKRPGRLHKHFGISEDKNIPVSKINKEIKRLKAKEKRTKSESSLLRALNRAKTSKSKSKKK